MEFRFVATSAVYFVTSVDGLVGVFKVSFEDVVLSHVSTPRAFEDMWTTSWVYGWVCKSGDKGVVNVCSYEL